MSAAREEMELQMALFHAIETEDFAKVRKCVRNGVDLSDEWRNEQGLTPLELARSKTNSEIEAFIFEESSLYTAIICLPMTISGYTRNDVLLDKDFYSLRAACSNGDSETVRRFIESGVDINTTDVHTRGYLWAACENSHLEIVEMLLKADADPNESPQALAAACWYNHLDVIKVLIRAGANGNGTDLNDRGLLWAALENNYLEVAKLLIDAGADMSQTYEADETLLLSALEMNRIDFAKLLIDSGANVNQSNELLSILP